MPFIAFLGCDGSGKSAVIEGVADQLRAGGIQVAKGHWCPEALLAKRSDSVRHTADDPHGQIPRGFLASVAKLGWLWLNWWVGWYGTLRKTSTSGSVLFDRYHGDLLVDPRRYRYGGPMWLARLASRFMPQPDTVVFLDAEPDVLLSRKQEVSKEALVASRGQYLKLATSHPRFRIVDASQPLDAVVAEVVGMLNVGLLEAVSA